MSHTDRVMDYLKKGHCITDHEARELWGCDRLSARILEVKERLKQEKSDLEVTKTMDESLNRYGEKTRHARYWLQKKGTAA